MRTHCRDSALAQSRDDQGDELDFVVVLTPSLRHEPNPRAELWEYPNANEILQDLIAAAGPENRDRVELGWLERR